MKKKLLFLAIVLLSVLKGFAQADAYPAPNLNQCGNEVFNLTVQTPIILGNQSPATYTVTYYTTQANADAGTSPIANPASFVSPQTQLVFARVTNNANGDHAVVVFTVSWTSGVFVPEFNDMFACEAYILPPLTVGNYYSGPGGTGTLFTPETFVTTTQTIYIYAQNAQGCTDESDFVVVINQVPALNTPQPLYACDTNGDGVETFDLTVAIPQISAGVSGDFIYTFHETQSDAEFGVNPIANPSAYTSITNSHVVYIAAMGGGDTTNCKWISPLELIIAPCNGNVVSGFVKLNLDGDCDTFEAYAAGIPVYYTVDNQVFVGYTNVDGHYSFGVPDGTGSIYLNGIAGSIVTPASQTVTMPGNNEPVNFCITIDQSQIINDVAATLIPITQARPGFVASYALIYQNHGTLGQSGTVSLQFDDTKMTFLSAGPAMTQSGNTLSLDYFTLMPFQTQVAIVNFTVMLPQVVPAGSILNFTASITPLTGDATPADNTSVVSQFVVNAYDPNDISVREGEFITEAQADDYLNYTIRFQNTGDANAENVRLVTQLDENLDWSTFEALSASDAFTVKHTDGVVEFQFTGIDLPFEDADEPGSHGYVIYRIKPNASVTVGDIMHAQAGIYFDFNDPIQTGEISTTVQATAGLNDNKLNSFTVYPNPASGNVNLKLTDDTDSFDVAVTDVLGKNVLNGSYQANEGSLNITSLKSGIYFVTVTADNKQQTKKLIIK